MCWSKILFINYASHVKISFIQANKKINQVFKYSLAQKHTRLNIYKTLAKPLCVHPWK